MTEQSTPNRIFKIGTTTIAQDDSLAGKSLDEIKTILQRTYPEVAHATVREITLEDGTVAVHYIPQAGKKG
ncbi:hypothetical protein G4Y79_01495 [Phototrophicus methaneseepsis]|jgi:hypothetical protein|uniref:PRTRC system protein C n=1 Tax=Phototrophicus methaneseepsis TaxID=2710758 RepID=A0A7S8EA69_9CHLR|nr:hypothetical protein [Phototrophicus methaneseepsis]QPC83078.1 hypothetical protein G4Y79_01495 [Phototrophicus methaneseepsis]